eukprot:m.10115 g.10115  ORF g.10115 m.10115 type:complete len:567 (-) comp3617_c0_seq1:192-1892(-)
MNSKTSTAMTSIEEAEASIVAALGDAKALKRLWNALDYNGNNIVSVAEVDKFLGENYPVLKHQPTIIRAFKYTTLIDGDMDSWVERFEFPYLLRNILYFHKLFVIFNELDSDGDHRVNFEEFKQNATVLGLNLSEEEAQMEFETMDDDGHGMVLFAELCRWYAVKKLPVDGDVRDKFTTYASNERKAAKKLCLDRDPDISTKKFKQVEKKLRSVLKNKKQLHAQWRMLDVNNNGIVSLAEVDKYLANNFTLLHNARAVMRAYKYTTLIDGDGDEWIEPDEFPALLRNLIYFNKIYDVFDSIDSDGDHRISLDEFKNSMSLIGLTIPDDEAEAEFNAMDSNSGGVVLFDEFAAWCAVRQCPVDGDVRESFVKASAEMRRKHGASPSSSEKNHKAKNIKKPKSKFAGAVQAINKSASDAKKLKLLWRKLDRSADGHLSLQEVSTFISGKYPPLGRKVALRRAFDHTVSADTTDGNDTIEENELSSLLKNIVIFHKILATFDGIDTDGSHSVSLGEFQEGMELLGLSKGADADAKVFRTLDADNGGTLSLSEFTQFALKHEDILLDEGA